MKVLRTGPGMNPATDEELGEGTVIERYNGIFWRRELVHESRAGSYFITLTRHGEKEIEERQYINPDSDGEKGTFLEVAVLGVTDSEVRYNGFDKILREAGLMGMRDCCGFS